MLDELVENRGPLALVSLAQDDVTSLAELKVTSGVLGGGCRLRRFLSERIRGEHAPTPGAGDHAPATFDVLAQGAVEVQHAALYGQLQLNVFKR